jgi:hypothetical protein
VGCAQAVDSTKGCACLPDTCDSAAMAGSTCGGALLALGCLWDLSANGWAAASLQPGKVDRSSRPCDNIGKGVRPIGAGAPGCHRAHGRRALSPRRGAFPGTSPAGGNVG